jgi:hypothetical protein
MPVTENLKPVFEATSQKSKNTPLPNLKVKLAALPLEWL